MLLFPGLTLYTASILVLKIVFIKFIFVVNVKMDIKLSSNTWVSFQDSDGKFTLYKLNTLQIR
jgi:hypothetical protein